MKNTHSQKIHIVAFLFLLMLNAMIVKAQKNPSTAFGNNAQTGRYLKMTDGTRIYYELYGAGKPLVLLHGGLFGDISEYEHLIPELSKSFLVIAIETRGHGKSEIGHQPYTYSLMAEDAYAIIKHVSNEPVQMIGFSDGANTAMALVLRHPGLVKKLIFVGGNLAPKNYKPGELEALNGLTGATMARDFPDFVKERKAIMPEPERWDEFVELLKHAWLQRVYFDTSELKHVTFPVLVVGGDRDQYNDLENFVYVYRTLPHASLAIIAGSDHIVFYNRPDLMRDLVIPFVTGP